LSVAGILALSLWALAAPPAPTPLPRLTLRDGRVFELTAAPRTEAGRVIFTTKEGKTYSLPASEVQSFVDVPPTPTRVPSGYNPQDSRALGAIARQERAKTGKKTDLSASAASTSTTPPHAKTKAPKKTRTPAPKKTAAATRTPTPTAAPHA
jgi:hypothetical protein